MLKPNFSKSLAFGAAITAGLLSQQVAADDGFYVGARLGLYEGYDKEARRGANNPKGVFKANGIGLTAGYRQDDWRYFFTYNPAVDAKVAGEVAPTESYWLGADYRLWQSMAHSVSAGGFIGHAEFELEIGPNGATFIENPTAKGMTYGLLASYNYDINDRWQVGAGLTLGLGEFDGDGKGKPAGDPIDIKIKQFQHVDATISYRF